MMIRLPRVVLMVAALVVPAPRSLWGGPVGVQDSTRTDSARVTLTPLRVEVTRSPAAVRNIPFSVATLSGAEIRRGRATLGLDEALAEVPGVLVSNRYNPSLDQRISIRGFGARSAFGVRGVKVMLDGVPQTLPDGQGQLTNLDLSAVETIEILNGSSSSLYGNAAGGVIDIRTATLNPIRATATARVQGGAYGSVKWRGAASLPVGAGALAVSLSRTTAGGFREHSESDQRNLAVRWQHAIGGSTTLRANLHASDNPRLDNPGSLNAAEVLADPSQANRSNVNAGAGKDVQQSQLGVTLEHRTSAGATLSVTAFGLQRALDNPLSFAYIAIDRAAYGARATVRNTFPGDLQPQVVVGVDWQTLRDDRINETPNRSALILDQLERVGEVGPFVQLSVTAARTTVMGGVRYDRVSFDAEDHFLADGDDSGDRTMSALSGSIGAVYHLATTFQPYGSVSTSFETPTTTELANQPTGPGGLNPALDPQKATTAEIGVRGSVGEAFAYTVAGFHSAIRDAVIPFEVPSEPSRRFFRNAGRTRHQGAEVRTTIKPSPAVSLVAAYTFARYRFVEFATADAVFDGNTTPGVPDHYLYASIRGKSSTGLWAALDNVVTTSQFVDDANSASNDGWVTVGLRGGWEGEIGGWHIAPFGGILNLLDEQYVGSLVVNAGFGRYFEPAPRRNAFLGVELRN